VQLGAAEILPAIDRGRLPAIKRQGYLTSASTHLPNPTAVQISWLKGDSTPFA
jgi:hypothetical protein